MEQSTFKALGFGLGKICSEFVAGLLEVDEEEAALGRRVHPIPVHSIHECACNRLLAKLMLTHLMLSSRICRWLHTHTSKQAGKAGRGQIGII